MPFCPNCRFEYVAGVERCPDCGAALVDSLPPEPTPSPPQHYREAQLCEVIGKIHARLLQEKLESQGIPSRQQFAQPFDHGIFRAPSVLTGSETELVRIIVREPDLDRARVIYADFESEAPERHRDEPTRGRRRAF
jgi:rRNA maturation protein Nop10